MAAAEEEIIWEYSETTEVPIQWQQFEVTVPIDPDRELTKFTFSLEDNSNVSAYFDNLEVLKNLMNDKLLANNIIFMPIEEVPAGTPFSMLVYGSVDLTTIVKVSYVPEQAIVGGEGLQLRMNHTITGGLICTKTFLEDSGAEAGIVTDFGPIDKEHRDVLVTQSVTFSKTAAGKLPKGILIIQWDIV